MTSRKSFFTGYPVALAAVAAVVAFTSANASASVLATYDFNSGSSSATTSDAGVTAGTFGLPLGGGGISSYSEMAYMDSRHTLSTESGALDGPYFDVTISATNSGDVLNLSSLTYNIGSNSANQLNTSVYLQSNVAGFGSSNSVIAGANTTFSNPGSAGHPPVMSQNLTTYDLSGSAFQNLSSIEFRIYFADNQDYNGDADRLDNFTLNGTVAAAGSPPAAPEPATLGLALLGSGLLLIQRRRGVTPD